MLNTKDFYSSGETSKQYEKFLQLWTSEMNRLLPCSVYKMMYLRFETYRQAELLPDLEINVMDDGAQLTCTLFGIYTVQDYGTLPCPKPDEIAGNGRNIQPTIWLLKYSKPNAWLQKNEKLIHP